MIHNLAYVHEDAKIGENVTIEPFAFVAGDTIIGDNSYISSHAVVLEGTRLGKGCKIHSGAVVGGVPQDLKFKGEYSTVEIGDNTTIRECATINRGSAAKGKTIVGNNCLVMAYAHIAHDCIVGDYVILVNNVSLAGEVEVGDWAILGGHSAVHQFVKIGEHAMVSGGSLVSKDIPPFVKAAHTPLSFVGANFIGLRRRNFSNETISIIQESFRLLFQSNLNYSVACDKIEEEIAQCVERDMIINFVRSSKRGVIKPYNFSKKDENVD
ncbi:MAG: acyl-ACP--UDP-N-acetylglucosamine O-acyltransferase [Rikenellaceae bacterium]